LSWPPTNLPTFDLLPQARILGHTKQSLIGNEEL
jgi:hypothetical protein